MVSLASGFTEKKLEKAIFMATLQHCGQVDKAGAPYILHPLRVMVALQSLGEVAMVAGVLHDMVEDTGMTLERLAEDFGGDVAEVVDAVSRRSGETYMDFIKRANEHPIGRIVKIADIRDNLLPERMTPELMGMRERYKKALEILGVGLS